MAQEANKPFWLQLVGTGITTALAMHLGAVLTHAQWPAVTCLNMYEHQLAGEPWSSRAATAACPRRPAWAIEVPRRRSSATGRTTSAKPRRRAVYAVVRPNGDRTYYLSETSTGTTFLAGNQIRIRAGRLPGIDS